MGLGWSDHNWTTLNTSVDDHSTGCGDVIRKANNILKPCILSSPMCNKFGAPCHCLVTDWHDNMNVLFRSETMVPLSLASSGMGPFRTQVISWTAWRHDKHRYKWESVSDPRHILMPGVNRLIILWWKMGNTVCWMYAPGVWQDTIKFGVKKDYKSGSATSIWYFSF